MRVVNLTIIFSLFFVFEVMAEPASDVRSISVSGAGSVVSTPDLFSFSVHIEEKGREAANLNKIIIAKTTEAVNTLMTIGVDKRAIQSLQVRFNPWIEYENKQNVQKGFSLTRKINITLDDIQQYDDAIDALLKIGISRIDSFNSSDSKSADNYNKALELSLINAKDRAKDMTKALGLKIGKVISISEQSVGRATPVVMDELRSFKASSYQPGEVSTQARVNVIFSLVD
ncbi:SIMPL domain-containing protein [Paraglaciecola sp. L3A3]|uniref:SIMPL domain-containing protein n=1 Tax=Paraglaciecola sp. L3A3 TaxID=2686358 RepID=UPI00131C488A|nr:SIMPL domain-containing protein [Paraglaciecola sp. L3A3]